MKTNASETDSDRPIQHRPTVTRSCNKVKEQSVVEESIQSSKTSWRDSKRHGSESSSDDNLEDFLQKLKKPDKKKSSEESTKSMKDFIVEDDEMTSESDDEVFYMRENQELDRAPLVDRLKSTRKDVSSQSEDSSDDDFSSKLYPSSVTKHKQKKKQQGKSHVSSVCSSLYWESSDDNENSKRKGKTKNKPQKSDSSDSSGRNTKKGTKTSNTNSKTNRKGTFQFSESDPENDMCVLNAKEKQSTSTTTTVKTNRKGTFQWQESDSDSDNISDQTEKETEKQLTKSVTKSKSTSKTETSKKDISLSDSDQDVPLFKTPNPIRRKVTSSTGASKLPDRSSDGSTSVFKTPSIQPRSVTSFSDYISLSDDDNSSDDDSLPSLSTSSNKENVPDCRTPVRTKTSDSGFKMPTPLSTLKTPKFRSGSESRSYSFLKSLSMNVDEGLRHPDAVKYIKNFKRTREELVKELFDLYNNTIFDKQLPSDLPIIWNKRLLKTAGYCAYRCSRANKEDRTARIELSTKVCDSAERVRDTLIHELCHAAVWLLNGVNGGHGNFWRYWARHASRVHQELPTISRCHSYSINTKFTYRCTRCGYSIGRHSKSLDTSKKICGYCKGMFELIQNATPMTPQSASSAASSVGSTPRTPNRFAMFVKDNYNSVKQKNKDLKHGDVMKELSRLFAANKINS